MTRTAQITPLLLALCLLFVACAREETPRTEAAAERKGPILSADGVRIAFESAGKGEPTLVFVHGWSGSGHSWDAQVAAFSKTHRVVTIDLAGHGASGANRREFTVESYAADVATVVNYLQLEDVILIGHSMGGPVVAAAAPMLAGKVRALVGADTFGSVDLTWSATQIDAWLAPMRADFPGAAARFVRGLMPENADTAVVGSLARGAARANPRVAVNTLEHFARFSQSAALDSAHLPLFLIASAMFPVDTVALRRHVPSYRLWTMKGVGHWVHMEDPQTFNTYLAEAIALTRPLPPQKQVKRRGHGFTVT